MDWLEPSIKKRIYQVVEISCKEDEFRNKYNEFTNLINLLRKEIPNFPADSFGEIECLLNQKIHTMIETAYRTGLSDGLMIKQNLSYSEEQKK
jgi:hypothetical protein